MNEFTINKEKKKKENVICNKYGMIFTNKLKLKTSL